MILVDANLLIYAYNAGSAQHSAAKAWLQDVFSGDEPVCLSWSGIHAFLRLTTERALMSQPFTMAEAVAITEEWLEQDAVRVIHEGNRYRSIFRRVLLDSQVRGAMVTDAHLAALAIEHGAILYTTDRDFRRFDGLRIVNPLAKK